MFAERTALEKVQLKSTCGIEEMVQCNAMRGTGIVQEKMFVWRVNG